MVIDVQFCLFGHLYKLLASHIFKNVLYLYPHSRADESNTSPNGILVHTREFTPCTYKFNSIEIGNISNIVFERAAAFFLISIIAVKVALVKLSSKLQPTMSKLPLMCDPNNRQSWCNGCKDWVGFCFWNSRAHSKAYRDSLTVWQVIQSWLTYER